MILSVFEINFYIYFKFILIFLYKLKQKRQFFLNEILYIYIRSLKG